MASGIRRALGGLGIAASGLSAQRLRMETVARNIANAETTRTADGGPYRRQVVQLRETPFSQALAGARRVVPGLPGGGAVQAPEVAPVPGAPIAETAGRSDDGGVTVAGVAEDATQGTLVYDPGHPDADEAGYVEMPNVDMTREMIDLMEARRMYEANASVFDALKGMLSRATRL